MVGDPMVDHYIFVETSRKAQEADIPIWDELFDNFQEGAAAYVAATIESLGPDLIVHFATSGFSMYKRRYLDISTQKVIFRHDDRKRHCLDDIEKALFQTQRAMRFKPDMVVVSDYNKGIVTPELVEAISSVPVKIVDSKRKDLSIFKGFNVLKLNQFEYSAQVGVDYGGYPVEALVENLVVTKGSQGCELRSFDWKESNEHSSDRSYRSSNLSDKPIHVIHSENFPASQKTAIDVTGCGDVHTAAMAVSLASSIDIRKAIRFANKAAAVAVEKLGTARVTLEETEI